MTEANSITQPHVGILQVNTSTVATEEYLETDNGVFQLQSIAGEKFRLLPKECMLLAETNLPCKYSAMDTKVSRTLSAITLHPGNGG
jgi:hypothetical protein